MRTIPSAIVSALTSASFRPLILVEMLFDTPLRFASTYDQITYDGDTYIGGANLGSIGGLQENSNLDPQQMEISLSGLNATTLSTIGSGDYLNKDVTVRVLMLDQDGNILGGTDMLWFEGKTDEVRFSYSDQNRITVTARDKLADWARPRVERNINADHQADYPGDLGFEFVAQVADADIIWPKKEFFE